MKKRLISLLLTMVMLVSLCPALATTASADAQVTTVTLNSGDTVLKLCQNIGVDFYAHKNLIMSLNGLTSEAQFGKMAAGSKVVLPVSNAAAASLKSSGVGAATTTTTPVAGAVTGATGAITGTSTSIPAGDYASYYLVNYTIQSGETIAGIYNNWGLSYKTYSNQILKLNNLASFNAIPAGKTLILPTTNPAIAGSNYTTVMAHVMRSGDSAYNIICSDYGLNYNAVERQIQALNNRTDLGHFFVGEVLYIPVTGLVSSSTTVTPSTGASSSTAIIGGSAAYNLVSQTPANGNFALVVDGNVANAAVAGKTVEIVATPNTGYALSQISVTKVGDPNTSVTVQGNKFVMPSFSVSVNVTFSQAIVSKITVDASSNGAVSAMVNSAVVSSATAGSLVTVKTIPATGFMLDTIRVTYNEYRDTVAVENGQFVMPTFPVTVSASFKVDPNYDPNKGHNIYVDAANAKVVTKIGDTEVSTAKAGDRVTLSITPDANYTVQNLAVYYDNFNKTVDVEKNAFTMPNGPITIVATVKPTSSAVFGITKVMTKEGNLSVTVNGQEASSANVGAKVQITGSSNSAYFNYVPTVFKTGDTSVTVPVAADGTFTMPDFPVSVSIKFYIYRNIYLDASNGTNGWFNVTAAGNGMAVSKAGAGVQLKVTVWGFNQNTHAPGDVIVTYQDGSVHNLSGATFIMPDCDIKVRVNFNPVQYITAYSARTLDANGANQHRGYNSYSVNGVGIDDNGNYTKTVAAGRGNTVAVYPAPALGYGLDRIEYKYYDVNGTVRTGNVGYNATTGRYQFEMPTLKSGTSFEMFVFFKQIKSYNIALDYDGSLGSVTALSSIGVVSSSVENAKITLKMAPKSGYAIDYAGITVTTASGKDVAINRNDYTFFMPNEDVTVHVPFKSELNKIRISPIPYSADNTTHKGMLNVLVNGLKYTEAQLTHERALPDLVKAGVIVTVINESSHGYILNPETPIVVFTDNTNVPVEMVDRDKFTFVMPNDDVTITANYDDDMYNIVALTTEKGTYSVPKQGNHTAPVKVTDIVPAPGFELDKILVTYTDFLGVPHKNEDITATAEFTPVGNGIPQSDVVFEVTFKPVLNPITIQYHINGTTSGRNFAVDLLKDGMLIDGFTRNATADPITDVLNVDKENNKGLPTGATIVIQRQDHNMDENFKITNMWIMCGDTAIKPEYANNQYFFTVPYVESGLAKDLVLHVEYSTDTAQNFRLEARPAEGVTGTASAEFKVGTEVRTYALPEENITVTLTASEGYKLDESYLAVVYQNSDGVDTKLTTPTSLTSGAATFKIPTVPKNGVAYVEYKVTPLRYTLIDKSNESGGGVCTFYAEPECTTAITSAAHGSTVYAKPIRTGFTVTEVKAVGAGETIPATPVADGVYSFTMPMGNTDVYVTYTASAYKLTSENKGTGSGTVEYKVGETVYPDGSAIPYGSDVIVVATPAEGSFVSSVDSQITTDSNGNYTFKMPNADTKLTVNFQPKTYTITITNNNDGTGDILLKTADAEYRNGEKLPAGVKVNIIATASAGCSYQGAYLGANLGDTDGDGNCDFVMPANDAELIVNFRKEVASASLMAAPPAPGSGDPSASTLNTYKLSDGSELAAEDAELKFYSSESSTEAITEAVEGSKVYGEITVKKYDKAVKDNKITWGEGEDKKASVNFDRVVDENTAVYKFEFTMPAQDTVVDYELADV
ncbi:MAG: LysM peptidoglycan-binding domain-containing protein, partial [Oscillospiraceae bacterium]|nr:LysM peptidoglycan-binding domain-containing protein [Oscillospiraceae bacterium]